MGYYQDEKRYEDIINLPHHVSTSRSHMSRHDRAAQFSPFSALTGYEAAIEETARIAAEHGDGIERELLEQDYPLEEGE